MAAHGNCADDVRAHRHVYGQRLGGGVSSQISTWLIVICVVALLAANTINVAADLAGMADGAEMLTGFNSHFYVIPFGTVIAFATVWFRYHQIAAVLKWLALSLFAYVFAAFIIGPDWSAVLRDTFVPTWPQKKETWAMLVAILGTTISPYLFYWQASLEVEEEKAVGRRCLSSGRARRKPRS